MRSAARSRSVCPCPTPHSWRVHALRLVFQGYLINWDLEREIWSRAFKAVLGLNLGGKGSSSSRCVMAHMHTHTHACTHIHIHTPALAHHDGLCLSHPKCPCSDASSVLPPINPYACVHSDSQVVLLP